MSHAHEIDKPAVNVPDDPLTTLRTGHPRIHLTPKRIELVKANIETSPAMQRAWASCHKRAIEHLDDPVASYDIPDGRRLLAMSRAVLNRTTNLAMAFVITGEQRFANRIWQDMEAVAAFDDWNPSHFLDTAEMSAACAIAYDWLYDHWTDQQRQVIREAIVKHGFGPALPTFRGEKNLWWHKARNNWNQVCNGGLITAALAVADEHPEQARLIVREAVRHMPIAMAHYGPDGGWIEGPAYWGYASKYTAFALSSLDTALGTDFGLGDLPGMKRAAYFPTHMTGPTGMMFNFADCKPGHSGGPDVPLRSPVAFFVSRYDLADLAPVYARRSSGDVSDLLWLSPQVDQSADTSLPLTATFRGTEAVAMRTAWGDPDAGYLATQCGKNPVGHNQADLGSFVYEAAGVRWAVDLGPDDYNLQSYFGPSRYDYFRNRAEGHNTIVINPDKSPGQDVNAGGTITAMTEAGHDAAGRAYVGRVTMVLAPVYDHATSYSRTLTLYRDRGMQVHDVVKLDQPGDVHWFWYTKAQIDVDADGRGATLTSNGQRLRLVMHSPAAARFETRKAVPLPTSPNPPGQNPNDGSRKANASGNGQVKRGELPEWTDPDPTKAYRTLVVVVDAKSEVDIRVEARPEAPGESN